MTVAPVPDVVVGWLTAVVDTATDAVALTVSAPPVGTAKVVLWRIVPSSAVPVYVRGYAPPGLPAPFVARDYEVPLDVACAYYAEAFNAAGASLGSVGPATLTVASDPADDPWLVDIALPLNTRRIVLESMNQLQHDAAAGVHRILGRRTPIVTTDIAYAFQSKLTFVTESADDEDAAMAALGNGIPILLRTPPEQGVGNVYLSVLQFDRSRVGRLALHTDRRFVVDVVQVDRPDPTLFLPVAPVTYAYVKRTFASYAAVNAQRASYDALANTPPGVGASPITPWPPEDV